jgi:hypothetical protein
MVALSMVSFEIYWFYHTEMDEYEVSNHLKKTVKNKSVFNIEKGYT